jgi:catechol 2,3-dioxygenase-like lactoylglutathione lyase family enzyme
VGICLIKKIGHITLLVKDLDEAAKFYIEKLGFVKHTDASFGPEMRWLTISPKDQPDVELTFVKADTKEKTKAVGKQAGDHVFLTMETDDCRRDYDTLKAKGVKFYGKPEQQPYGTEVVFEDLYGNLFDLIQRNNH